MPWQLVIIIYIFTSNIVTAILIKKIVSLPSKTIRQYWQYFFCVLLSLAFLIIKGGSVATPVILIIGTLGILNSLAVFCEWRAVNISLSKTSLFAQADDIFAILLGFAFLNELKILNPLLIAGIILCFSAAILLLSRRSINNGFKDGNKRLLWLILGFSFIWGLTAFLMRYFALEGVTFPVFLLGWYGGSLIGTAFIYKFKYGKRQSRALKPKEILNVFPLSFFIWVSLLLAYWVYHLAPIAIVQPIFLVTKMIFPTLVGLYFFKERKDLTSIEILAMIIGFIGGLIIALGF
ncbi:hypothetical protein KJ840_05030 [Patescibacteria group bacterium]|nr:hypothetical protein [Patescibacteria group bacterium]